MTVKSLRAGFMPLVDAAPLIVALEKGFAESQGVDLQLKRSNSWAGLRDRLSVGDVDAAHMLPPIAIASQLGLGNPKAPMVVPCGLSMNGNAISVSNQLFAAMQEQGWDQSQLRDPGASARALAKVVTARREAGEAALVFASVYPFSPHMYELRYWLAYAGLDPDRDVHLTIVPPPMVVAALEEGHIDGFCVGAPWSGLGAASGLSQIVCLKVDMWAQGPEKVIAVRENWANDQIEITESAIRMLFDAAQWCADPSNQNELAQILCGANYLDLPASAISGALSGSIPGAPQPHVQNHILFDPTLASFPNPAHAAWFYAQMVRWGQVDFDKDALLQAKKTYLPDSYYSAMQAHDAVGSSTAIADTPQSHALVPPQLPDQLMLFDGQPFDPADVPGYLQTFG